MEGIWGEARAAVGCGHRVGRDWWGTGIGRGEMWLGRGWGTMGGHWEGIPGGDEGWENWNRVERGY